MQEALAWVILGLLWFFGGAAFFDSYRTKYVEVLKGWALINVFVVGVALLVYAAFWAFMIVFT